MLARTAEGGRVKERPILFNGAMVRAEREGRKTQTRRLVNGDFMCRPDGAQDAKWYIRPKRQACWDSYETLPELVAKHSPYGVPGDLLYVRETYLKWYGGNVGGNIGVVEAPGSVGVTYCADMQRRPAARADWDKVRGHCVLAGCEDAVGRWRPSIHMPRWASRTLLEVVEVRVERLMDISEADAEQEGVASNIETRTLARDEFATLWDSINGARPGCSWDANPWVWVVGFKRVEQKAEAAE
jgi:hypothetical protein